MPSLRILPLLASLSASALVLSLASQAHAQSDLPQGTQTQTKASTGSTEIVNDKYQGHTRHDPDAKDATEVSLALGGLLSTGNARLLALTGASKLRLRRERHQFRYALAANYARSAAPDDPALQTSVKNFQGLTRYDIFLGNVAPFVALQGRRDTIQGLEVRMQFDPGVAYYFINEKKQLFWVEGGYDLLYDVRTDDSRVARDKDKNEVRNPDGSRNFVVAPTRTVHSARFFLGYEQTLSDTTKFNLGAEFLQGLSDTALYRFNTEAALTTQLFGDLAVSFSFSERYESKPIPGKRKLDTLSSFSLVYTLL